MRIYPRNRRTLLHSAEELVMGAKVHRIAVIWRGDWDGSGAAAKYEARLAPVCAALRAAGFAPAPMAFVEETAEAFRTALFGCDGALVWVNPLAQDRDRTQLDAILRAAAARGLWVSAHPDVISAMATKEVLYRTRALGWGSDTKLYQSAGAFAAQFLVSVAQGARVLKPQRGNDGRGVIKVSGGPDLFSVQATASDHAESMSWPVLQKHVAEMFASTPAIIDQECHDAGLGMVRCYMSFDRVIGFCEQEPRSAAAPFAMNSSKAMHDAGAPMFAALRAAMEGDWTPRLMRLLNLETAMLPALWDADFLRRGARKDGSDYALCEINASCVSPFPEAAPAAIASGIRAWVGEP